MSNNKDLQRTSRGTAALAKFYNVDFVFICEGRVVDSTVKNPVFFQKGDPSSFENSKSDKTLDAWFWSEVLLAANIKKKFVIKSYGSKSEIFSLRDYLSEHGVSGVFFGVDRDYSDFGNIYTFCDKTLITYGYSWESDVIGEQVIDKYLKDEFGSDAGAIINEISDTIDSAIDSIKKYINHEIYGVVSSVGAVFDREKMQNSIKNLDSGLPEIDESKIQSLIDKKMKICQIPDYRIGDKKIREVVYGKLMTKIIYHTVKEVIKNYFELNKMNGGKLSYSEFMRRLIIANFSLLEQLNSGQKKLYYSSIVERIA